MSRCVRLHAFLAVFSLTLNSVACNGEDCMNVGSIVPDFQSLDDQGQSWSWHNTSDRLAVIFFYPSDFSFCCTRQVRRYRDLYREFAKRGVEVIGISGD